MRKTTHNKWLPAEVEYLTNWYEKLGPTEIGLSLNRTPKSTWEKWCKMKTRKNKAGGRLC